MSLIDVFLLGLTLVASGVLAWRRPVARRIVALTLIGLALAAALQVAVEGIYWQFLPAYLLVATTVLLALGKLKPGRFARIACILLVTALTMASLGTWAVLPVPRLAKPDGPYAVGTEILRWVDPSRPEDATPAPADRRNVIVQAWYPAQAGATGRHSTYIDGLGRLPPSVSVFPRFLLSHFDRIDTHGLVGAPISTDRGQWPVVLFSPGYGGPRAFYTGLVSDLASRGYVVLAVDHPYEAAVTQLADGHIAATVEHFVPGDPDRIGFMTGRQDLRVADLRFVVDQLSRPNALGPKLAGRLDLDHIAAIGHSLGGATAVAAMDGDRRIKAAANIDGTPYGSIVEAHLDRPFLLLQSDYLETRHGERFMTGNGRLLDHSQAPRYRYEIARSNHFSFTDAPMVFSPPARFVLARLIGGERGPVDTQRVAVDILDAFLSGPLGRPAENIASAAARHDGVKGGPRPAPAPAPAPPAPVR